LTAAQAEAWLSPSWYAKDQSLGESVVRFALPVLALCGLCCHAERRGRQAYLRRADQWLGAPLLQADREGAQAELVRRYLRCFGPSTARHFAGWAGISPDQAGRAWRWVENELAEVQFDRHTAFLLEADLERFQSPPAPEGVRFLPPHDPYLQLRDRATLIPEKALQRRIWRAAGSPGAVLVEGKLAATWRSQKQCNPLTVRLAVAEDPLGNRR
jgi:hypothetical protein